MKRARIVVFASGTKTGGGSGFEKLVEASRTGVLEADIVAVVSQHARGGVHERAVRLGVTFVLLSMPSSGYYLPDPYGAMTRAFHADYSFLSGWTLRARGLNPRTTINIHSAPLPGFGGRDWYGIKVHERMLAAYRKREIWKTAVSMHFVTEEYDAGPVFFKQEIDIKDDDTAHTLAARVNVVEHRFQTRVSNLVVTGQITWDGVNPTSLRVPSGYLICRPVMFVEDERLILPPVVRVGNMFYVTVR